MENEIQVKVKWRHIKAGWRNYCSPTQCPIAQALQEQLPTEFISVSSHSFTLGKGHARYKLGKKALFSIFPVLCGFPTIPFTFVAKREN